MMNFLRQSRTASLILTLIRVFLGVQWLEAGLGKLLAEEGFSASGIISGALNGNANPAYPWFTSFLSFTTNAGENTFLFDSLIPWGQVLVGLALIFGAFTLLAGWAGLLMNSSFLLAGIISENPTFIYLQIIILIAGFNSARVGLDYWITPMLRRKFPFLHNDISTIRS
ncbi:Crp/Fnr family transcriptional regulator [Lactococcus termiticola]|uniref:DoxX family protein n=1 Tax=Lactococcus termiticola TaxID=2169526 RepID=A0A2R5HD39_9LACT|nr:Crp/Fnr family transcriptional regulator [Lactococcus termiticola]GBG95932.1 hypothetical protein NtB2_00034 [Lactococcus termiticola]